MQETQLQSLGILSLSLRRNKCLKAVFVEDLRFHQSPSLRNHSIDPLIADERWNIADIPMNPVDILQVPPSAQIINQYLQSKITPLVSPHFTFL